MAEMVICKGCKKQIHRTARACPHCGAPQAGARRGKSRIGAALLAFFLGGLGIHRFYLGQWWGIFYLLFCWTLIPGVIAFIEFIVFLCTSEDKWNDKYNDGMPAEGGVGVIVIIIVVVGFVMVAMIGILAAIALPAYSDYLNRAKVVEALYYAKSAGRAVGAHYETTQTIPQTLAEVGFDDKPPMDVREIHLNTGNGLLTVTMKGGMLEGKSFRLEPALDDNKRVVWTCAPVDIQMNFLPRECREGSAPATN